MRFETMPSRPILQAWAKTVGPSPYMLIEPDAGASLGQDGCERGLADLERVAPQVVAVQLNEVEAVKEDIVVMALVANEIERRHAVAVARHSLAIDDAGTRAQMSQRLSNQWEAASQIVARPAVEPHPLAILPGDNSKAIVLDFMYPKLAGREL